MPGPNLLQLQGSRTQKEVRFAPIWTDRFFTGLYTNRNPLRSPLSAYFSEGWRLGATDALIDGLNTELSSRLTIIRRPGNTKYTSFTIPDVPQSFYSFNELDGPIKVMTSTPSWVYEITNTLTAPTQIFKKSLLAGQTYFQGVGDTLFMGDGINQVKWVTQLPETPAPPAMGSVSGGTLPAATYFARITYLVGSVESVAGGESSLAVLSNNLVTVTAPAAPASFGAVTGWNVYISTSSGTETKQNTSPLTIGSTFTEPTSGLITGSLPPISSTLVNAVLPPPSGAPTLSQTAGGTLAATTYYVVVTYVNAYGTGETTKSPESSLLVSANNLLVVAAPPMQNGALGWNVYISTSPGTETKQNVTPPILPFCSPFTEPTTGLIAGAALPSTNTAEYVVLWGIVAPASAPQLTTNAVGTTITSSATVFDGVTGYVTTTVNRFRPVVYTYEILFKTSATQNQVLFGFENEQVNFDSGFGSHYFYLDSGGHLGWASYDADAGRYASITTVNSFNDGNLHHAVATVAFDSNSENGNVVLYVDGAVKASATPVMHDKLQTFTGYFRIGEGGSTAAAPYHPPMGTKSFFKGTLSRAAFYEQFEGSVLSAGQVLNHYLTLVSGGLSAYDTLVLSDMAHNTTAIGLSNSYYWKLNETTGATATDSFDSNPGTYQGGVTLNQTTTVFLGTWLSNHAYNIGDKIVDSNGNSQLAIVAGTSGLTQPTWATQIGQTTFDPAPSGPLKWQNEGPFGLSPTSNQGFIYVYSYKNSLTGHVSTASLPSNQTGPGEALLVTVQVVGSSDPQVDTIEIYRTADGGSTFFFLGDIPNPCPGTTVTFTDNTQDSNLNILIQAPVDHKNDPPPNGSIIPVFHMGRIWVAVGTFLYASGGPDTNPGSGNEAFPPINVWKFDAVIVRLVPISSGLLIFTTNDVWILTGGPQLVSFVPILLISGLGLRTFNALDIEGAVIYLFSADQQMLSMEPSAGVSEIGFPIGDKLGVFDATKVYVAFHISGSKDKALFTANGSTGWYRCNPHQAPDSGISGPVWSPLAGIVGGVRAIGSIETAPGTRQLLLGGTQANQFVLTRDSTFSTFTDNGSAYEAYFTLGSIVLAQPGQMAQLGFIAMDFIKTGTSPIVGVLLNEISGTFETISGYVVSDPPHLYGPTGGPASLFSNRYYFYQTVAGNPPQPAWARHLAVKVDYGSTDIVENEILSFTLYGSVWAEK